MDLFDRYGNLLRADGTNQSQRALAALEAAYIRPDERSVTDLVEYARKLAAEVRFYDLGGRPTGDWRPSLEALVDPATDRVRSEAELDALLVSGLAEPHVALFVVFLKLFSHLQGDLNELPQRHLTHYYERELRLERRPADADSVHVIFELARNAAPERLPAGTALDAGKDQLGQPLVYATKSELVVNAGKVAEIRRLVVETDQRGAQRIFVADRVSELEGPSFYTCGREQLDLDPSQRFMLEAQVGFALSSPVLLMAEGTRTVRVTGRLRGLEGDDLSVEDVSAGVELELTGDEGWIRPDQYSVRLVRGGPEGDTGHEPHIEIELTLSEAAPPVVPFDAALHGPSPVSDRPVLRVRLKLEGTFYNTFQPLELESVTIEVSVTGVRKLVVQNEQGVLTAGQPIPLFGAQPRIGSRFYVGSREVFGKKLTDLTLHFEWKKPPPSFIDHYQAYFEFVDADLAASFQSLFSVDVSLLYERRWLTVLGSLQSLFGMPLPDSATVHANESAFTFPGVDVRAQPDLEEGAAYDVGSKYGFLLLTLRGPTREDLVNSISLPYASKVPFEAFGHEAFSRRYAIQALALSRWDGMGNEPLLPNEPYTPVLSGLSLDYDSKVEFVPGDVHADEQMFVLGPWGHVGAEADVPARLVPNFDGVAELRLGLETFDVPANLSLLFQIEAGTATGETVLESTDVQWSYLSGPAWLPLPTQAVLSDTTHGFQEPGLVVLSVPADASREHTDMPSQFVWVRAVLQKPPSSVARTLSLRAQAALATLTPQAGTLSDFQQHLAEGLAPGLIKRLRRRVAAVKKVEQPYASFGGRDPEAERAFFTRSSERLRHRNRAVTVWDYERLVLEHFPEVFKVKCLPHSNAEGEDAPGELALVIVPDLRGALSTNPLEPRAGTMLMDRIHDYLSTGLTTSFATFHVIHPIYERVRIDARVRFRAGLDPGFYGNLLNEDLRRFLSPWAYEEGRDIVFGARIYRSEILSFMEGREYVDNVTNLNLYHLHDSPPRGGIGQMQIGLDFVIRPDPTPQIGAMTIGDDLIVGSGVELAEATRPHAILASHASHRITPFFGVDERCSGVTELGIGYLTVGLDFTVAA